MIRLCLDCDHELAEPHAKPEPHQKWYHGRGLCRGCWIKDAAARKVEPPELDTEDPVVGAFIRWRRSRGIPAAGAARVLVTA